MVRHCLGTLISERVGVLLSFEPNDLVMRKRGSTLLESLLIQCPVAWRCWYVFYFMSDSSQQFRRNAVAILGSRMIAIPGNPKKWMTRTHINSQYPSRDLWQHPNTLLVGGLEHLDYFSIYIYIFWEFHHPNWLSYFSEGWLKHQPVCTVDTSRTLGASRPPPLDPLVISGRTFQVCESSI